MKFRASLFWAALALPAVAVLSGCATTYGTRVGEFSMLSIQARSAPQAYRIIRHSDFIVAFPERPREVQNTDARLSSFFEGRPVSMSNQKPFPYRSGRYFIAFECKRLQRFEAFSLPVSQKPRLVEIACP